MATSTNWMFSFCGIEAKKESLRLICPWKFHIFGCYRVVYCASFCEKFTIACSEVLTGKQKGNPKSFPLSFPSDHGSFSYCHKCGMILSECFMLAVVNFAWRNAQVLHHFISTNEAVNENIFFVYLPSRLRAETNELPPSSWAKWLLSTKFFCISLCRKAKKIYFSGPRKSAECNW